MERIQEQLKQQHIPVKVYRTDERLMIAAPMAGLKPENIVVEVTAEGCLILHGDLRGMLKEVKELLLDEWSVGIYHRELALPVPVDGKSANVTYGNGVLTVMSLWADESVDYPVDFEPYTPAHHFAKGKQDPQFRYLRSNWPWNWCAGPCEPIFRFGRW